MTRFDTSFAAWKQLGQVREFGTYSAAKYPKLKLYFFVKFSFFM